MIEVDQLLAEKENFENPIEVQHLAKKVIAFWRKKFGNVSNCKDFVA